MWHLPSASVLWTQSNSLGKLQENLTVHMAAIELCFRSFNNGCVVASLAASRWTSVLSLKLELKICYYLNWTANGYFLNCMPATVGGWSYLGLAQNKYDLFARISFWSSCKFPDSYCNRLPTTFALKILAKTDDVR